MCQTNEFIRHAAHGRNYRHDFVTLFLDLDESAGYIADAVDRAHGGATVFLYDKCHNWSGL